MQDYTREQPLYVSAKSFKNLWHEYRIYADRIELDSFLGRKIIPAGEILEVEVRPPLVVGDIFRGKGFRNGLALKLDIADLCPHVAILRGSGWFRHLRFAPDDPDAFVRICKSIMSKIDQEHLT